MILKIYDSEGTELELGDLLIIKNNATGIVFYTKMQLINNRLFPFATFSFSQIIKVDKLPSDVQHKEADENTPEYWRYVKKDDGGEVESLKWRMTHLVYNRLEENFFKVYPSKEQLELF